MPSNDLPTRIRATRASRGLTLDQAAEQIGVGRMTLWRWEVGRCSPRGLQLASLVQWLAVSRSLTDP